MSDEKLPPRAELDSKKLSPKLISWIIICCVVAIASVAYRVLVLNHLEQSSLLFIGIPLLLSIGLAMTPKPKSLTGVILKGITLGLLLSGILLIEGVICIMMAAPLFYLVGGIVGGVIGASRKRNRLNCSVIGILAVCCLEGTTSWLSFDREEKVVVSRSLQMSAREAHVRLANGPEFDFEELPLFLKCGFPLPQSIQGDGIKVGDEWRIHFAGGEGKPGDLILKVVDCSDKHVSYQCVHDYSHVAHWLDWKTITWKFVGGATDSCDVEITLEYDRLLDPAWYFKPIERYGVAQAGEYLMSQTFEK